MEDFAILSALAQIEDVQDFRLKDFMAKVGLDVKQPAAFYRELIKESREASQLLWNQDEDLRSLEEENSRMEETITKQQREIADLQAQKVHSETEYRQRINELENENQQLRSAVSKLNLGARRYEGIKILLLGRMNVDNLCDLFYAACDLYEKTLRANPGDIIQGEDLGRLAPLRTWLRDDLRAVLEIPQDELAQRLIEAEKDVKLYKDVFLLMAGAQR